MDFFYSSPFKTVLKMTEKFTKNLVHSLKYKLHSGPNF